MIQGAEEGEKFTRSSPNVKNQSKSEIELREREGKCSKGFRSEKTAVPALKNKWKHPKAFAPIENI